VPNSKNQFKGSEFTQLSNSISFFLTLQTLKEKNSIEPVTIATEYLRRKFRCIDKIEFGRVNWSVIGKCVEVIMNKQVGFFKTYMFSNILITTIGAESTMIRQMAPAYHPGDKLPLDSGNHSIEFCEDNWVSLNRLPNNLAFPVDVTCRTVCPGVAYNRKSIMKRHS